MNTYTLRHVRAYLTKWHFEADTDALETVRRLRSVQFDPLNVVGRNPDLVLQSRVRNYRPEMLNELLYTKRALIDGFDKMLCVYPVEDYPYLKRLRDNIVAWFRDSEHIKRAMDDVINEVRARGPLCSGDIDMNEKVSWPWGPTRLSRATLESLWMSGRLIIHHKAGSRRYYDLAERHLDACILDAPDPNTTDDEYFAWQLERRISSVGLLKRAPSDAFLGIDGFGAEARARAFDALAASGVITQIQIEGLPGVYCVPARNISLIERALDTPCKPKARILAPLDNFMWDRKLIRAVFGFEYRWEVYVPADARKYGYYVLPVMLGDKFIGRFEPEHFRGGALSIKRFWWEEGVKPTKAARAALDKCFSAFAAYLGADGVRGAEEILA